MSRTIRYEKIGSELSLFADPRFESKNEIGKWSKHLPYCEMQIRTSKNNTRTDDDTLFAHELILKHLKRGTLTFPTYAIERHIVINHGSIFEISELENNRSGAISYSYNPRLENAYASFSNLLDDWNGNPDEVEFDPEHPENERTLFSTLLSEFGSRIAQCSYPQIDLEKILPGHTSNSFLGQRGDLLLSFPNGRGLLLEPGDHDDKSQQLRDRQRDHAFLEMGIKQETLLMLVIHVMLF